MKIIFTRIRKYKKIFFLLSVFWLIVATGSQLLAQYSFTRTFDAPQPLVDKGASNGWFIDRFTPHEFSTAYFDSRTVLKETISTQEGAINRPTNDKDGFRNTQGRSILLPDGTLELSVDLYIPDDWLTGNKRMAGLWAAGSREDGSTSEIYPILEFATDIPDGGTVATPRFQGYDDQQDAWVSLGLPTDFAFNKWYTLKIHLDPAAETTTYSVEDKSINVPAGDVKNLKTAILQGFNYAPSVTIDENNPGVNYDIYWDNLISVASGNNIYNEAAEKYYTSIQKAVNDAAASNHLIITGSQYNEQIIIEKMLTLEGRGITQPQLDFTGNVTGKPTIIDIGANNVTIKNLGFKVDLSKLSSAVIASSAQMDSVSFIGNHVIPYKSSETLNGQYTDRNAFSVNYGGKINYRAGGDHKIYFDGNTVEADLAIGLLFRSGLSADVCTGIFTNNTIQSLNQDLSIRFFKNDTLTIKGNHFIGGGVEIVTPESKNGLIEVENNTFDGSLGNAYTSSLRLKDNFHFMPAIVNNNDFINHRWAISVENFSAITIDNNNFTPIDTATFYRHITFNTKDISTTSGFENSSIGGAVTGNTFNGSAHRGIGIGVAFYNHDSEGATIYPFIIGSNGHENTFSASIGKALYLDNSDGEQTSDLAATYPEYGETPATLTAYWVNDIDATNNNFDVGNPSGLIAGRDMNYYEAQAAAQQIFDHDSDLHVGKVILNTPVINITKEAAATDGAQFRYATIQEAIDAASMDDSIYARAWVYNEDVIVNKGGIKLHGDLQYGVDTTILMGPNSGAVNTLAIKGNNVHISNLMITRSGNATDFVNNVKSSGVHIQGNYNGIILKHLLAKGNRTGIYINNTNGTIIDSCDITFNRTGIQLVNTCNNTVITHNNITDNWTVGVLVYEISAGSTNEVMVNYNKISGNWYSEVENRSAGTILNFNGNNWNRQTMEPVEGLAGEPEYPDLIPVKYGGEATYEGGTHFQITGGLDRVDYSAWLPDSSSNAINNHLYPGYAPRDTSVVYVDEQSPTALGMSKMARAQSIVATGGKIISTSDVLHAVIEPGKPFELESASGNLTIDGIDFGTEQNPATIEINQNITISNSLKLGNGEIKMGAGNTLTIDASTASIDVGEGSGFISGTLVVENIPNAGTFTFPVGDSTSGPKYLEFAPTGGTTGSFTVNYSNEGFANKDLGDDGINSLTSIDQTRFWNFERTAGDLKGKVTIVDYTNSLPLTAVIAHFGSDNKWHNLGGTFIRASDPQVLQAELESDDFSPFTVGSTEAALPINLVDFNAQLIGNRVRLTWETLTENNSIGFGLERSQDGKNWQEIAFITSLARGGASTQALHYAATDNAPLTGINYYRLRQEIRGKAATYGETKSIQIGQGSQVSLYPSPARDRIRVSGMAGTISIYNAAGKLILSEKATATLQWINISHLPVGMYFIKDSAGHKTKFIKQ